MDMFRFKLQKLLDIREEKEEQSKIEFKNAMDDCKKSEEKLTNLKDNYLKYSSRRINGSALEQKQLYNYLNAVSFSIDAANEEVVRKQNFVEHKRKELLVKQREKKTVQVLKDKQKEAFVKEIEYKEQQTNDEFALYGFIRNLKGGEI
ncbi:flagellar export protein FliJ [Clostridium cellulovorans]|uniref:Flagellar FliJ protein n=1 Tax=Clostridium cellulovorans (strain ATCC 35296 / DSM 3052 / OCM 3 / 743B) TaxID=573061 RepID=D9SKG6_CLOC7|nr:flagellar export protein FliJ [Clostridium cellulovorans]ADL51462.1 flagellar export protein FliJ [Clostridium cellulovorans 743B]